MTVLAERAGFGDLLRGHRTAAGLSQEALAERAGLSTRAISDLERGVKTRPHPNTLRLLADALGLDAAARAALAASARPVRTLRNPGATVPVAPHPMLGREAEMAAALKLLGDSEVRLVTLTGPGGVGKTTLGRAIGSALAHRFQVTFVGLAALPAGAGVIPTVASSLGLRDDGSEPIGIRLRTTLASGNHLLILDNCEHVLPDVRALFADLRTDSGPWILATSRAPLRLQGERLLPVAPLPSPPRDADLATVTASASVSLFVERTRAVRSEFALTAANAGAVAEICRRLDGLPLALELAAARMRILTAESLAKMLDQRLRVLASGPVDAPDRHRTLHATVMWSFELLEPDAQALFRQLAVFAGGASLEAVASVTGESDALNVLDRLEDLVDQGLVALGEINDQPRYQMLETVREVALGLLRDQGEEEATRAAHARAMLAFATAATAGLATRDRANWVRRLGEDDTNLAAALEWAIVQAGRGDASLPLQLADAIWPWWHLRGRHREASAWLDRALIAGKHADPRTQALAFLSLANTATNLDQHDRADSLYRRVHTIAESLDRIPLLNRAQIGLALVATNTGRYDDAARHLAQAAELARQEDSDGKHFQLAYAEARLSMARGDLDRAREEFAITRELLGPASPGKTIYLDLELITLERLAGSSDTASDLAANCLATFREMGERLAEAAVLIEMALLAIDQGSTGLARDLIRQAAEIAEERGNEHWLVHAAETASRIATADGQWQAAAMLLGIATAWRDRSGTIPFRWEQAAIAEITARIETALAQPELTECRQRVRSLGPGSIRALIDGLAGEHR